MVTVGVVAVRVWALVLTVEGGGGDEPVFGVCARDCGGGRGCRAPAGVTTAAEPVRAVPLVVFEVVFAVVEVTAGGFTAGFFLLLLLWWWWGGWFWWLACGVAIFSAARTAAAAAIGDNGWEAGSGTRGDCGRPMGWGVCCCWVFLASWRLPRSVVPRVPFRSIVRPDGRGTSQEECTCLWCWGFLGGGEIGGGGGGVGVGVEAGSCCC